jgi:hypothetical protein
MSAQIQQISADAQQMAEVAVSLRELMANFRLENADPERLSDWRARRAA